MKQETFEIFLDDLDDFATRDEVCDAAEVVTGARASSKKAGLEAIERCLFKTQSPREIRRLVTQILTEVYSENLKTWTRDVVDEALNKDEAIDALLRLYVDEDSARKDATTPSQPTRLPSVVRPTTRAHETMTNKVAAAAAVHSVQNTVRPDGLLATAEQAPHRAPNFEARTDEQLMRGGSDSPVSIDVVRTAERILPDRLPFDKAAVIASLKEADGNMAKAARALRCSRSTLQNRMREYGLPRGRSGRPRRRLRYRPEKLVQRAGFGIGLLLLALAAVFLLHRYLR